MVVFADRAPDGQLDGPVAADLEPAEEFTDMARTLVQIQTLRGNAGKAEALKAVVAAVDKFNAGKPKGEAHTVVEVNALPNNTKGMQAQLALLATLARRHGATMIRLSVHNGSVALCGTTKSIEAVQAAMVPAYNSLSTMVAAAYNPAVNGNRVGFTNGWMCGAPAGMQEAWGIQPELAYGVGFLFSFPAPGDGVSYDAGVKAVREATKLAEGAEKPKAERKTRQTRQPKATETATEAPALPEEVAA